MAMTPSICKWPNVRPRTAHGRNTAACRRAAHGQIPVNREYNREFRRLCRHRSRSTAENLAISILTDEFPSPRNREFIPTEPGNKSAKPGIRARPSKSVIGIALPLHAVQSNRDDRLRMPCELGNFRRPLKQRRDRLSMRRWRGGVRRVVDL